MKTAGLSNLPSAPIKEFQAGEIGIIHTLNKFTAALRPQSKTPPASFCQTEMGTGREPRSKGASGGGLAGISRPWVGCPGQDKKSGSTPQKSRVYNTLFRVQWVVEKTEKRKGGGVRVWGGGAWGGG